MSRRVPVPTLYVKTLDRSTGVFGPGPQWSVRQIFLKARQSAPCLLMFEDIDSLVTDDVRTYFLNEVDGLENNDGILMIGSTSDMPWRTCTNCILLTNSLDNLDKLDQGLSKRPSRFDRKYRFTMPAFEERSRYCELWR
jgi:transitional endoplasmic reticulum ATPase